MTVRAASRTDRRARSGGRRVRSAAAVAAALACVAAAPGARAQAPEPELPGAERVLLDRSLRAEPIRLLSLDRDSIVYEDRLGRRRTATVGGFVALLPPADPATTATSPTAPRAPGGGAGRGGEGAGMLELTDGQRFPGDAAPTGAGDDALVWEHPSFGALTVPLDQIARLALPRPDAPDAAAPPTGADVFEDTLILVNGDVLTGFIVGLDDPVEFDRDGETIRVPRDRVSSAGLANEPNRLEGLVVWLDDGTVAVVTSVLTRGEERVEVRLPGGQSAEFDLGAVRAVAFEAGRLTPLANLAPLEQAPLDRPLLLEPMRSLAPVDLAPDLNAPDLLLPGPMEVVWALPTGARRLSAAAELPLDALPWADCELVVRVDGEERFRARLSQTNREQSFSVNVEGRELSIAVEAGEYGPVNDRVLLRRPLLLVEERSAPGTD